MRSVPLMTFGVRVSFGLVPYVFFIVIFLFIQIFIFQNLTTISNGLGRFVLF